MYYIFLYIFFPLIFSQKIRWLSFWWWRPFGGDALCVAFGGWFLINLFLNNSSFISFSNGLFNGSGSFRIVFYSSYSSSFYSYIILYLLSYLFILSLYSIAKKNVIKKEYFVYIFLKNIYKKTPIYIVLFCLVVSFV